ncbi:amidohydrolase family protein [Nonomuraea sediminis]|uniref:amidohydrolase family protein n=1 Tax=Nonomuraea sediminis TaxID=2835864 RepID=UPI001BDC9D2D|nr:amidohydrolase family protein [Nonomuraea sediminis]
MTTVIRNGIVIDTEPNPVVLRDTDVLIEDGKIAAVGKGLSGDEVIDATGRIVLPGFVDSHRHTWQAAIRAVAPNTDFAGYLRTVLGELAPRFAPEDVRAGNLAGALEALDAGITTLLDWSHIQFTPQHTDATVDALRASGIRAVFGYCYGGPAEGFEAETRRVRDLGVPMAMAALGPEIVSREQALREWRLAAELDLDITAHLGSHSGQSAGDTLAWLRDSGLLEQRITYIHANHYTDEALKVIAESGGSVSVSPIDEMTLGMGDPITGRARAAGMPVSLSADTVVCAPGDMFSLMRAAFMMERGRITVADTLRMATLEGAQVVGLGDVVGSLRPGKQADLVLLRTDTLGMAAAHDPIGAVVLNADTSTVDTVLVGGKVVKRDGRLVGHDLAKVLSDLDEAARRVLGTPEG